MQNANTAFAGNQAAIGQFNKNIGVLGKGGAIGADPWLNPAYLATQNKLTSNATSGENDAAAKAIADQNLRSGGTNTSGTAATIKDLALRKMRLADTLNAQRSAQDFGKNVDYQKFLAEAPLSAAGLQGQTYGTSTTGQDSSLHDLSSFGLASYGPWESLIQAAGGAAAAALGPHPSGGSNG